MKPLSKLHAEAVAKAKTDVIRMARGACDADKVDAWHNGFWTLTQEELEKFAALVAAAEREACAKLCDGWTQADGDRCAEAIRARKELK